MDLNEYISNLILESDTSDDSIWYRVGKYQYDFKPPKAREVLDRNWHLNPSDKKSFRKNIIKWQKATQYPLLKDSDEIIHRSKWDLDGLCGETEKQLFHPDYQTVANYIMKNVKRQHDVLTVFECSNSKPYFTSNLIRTNYLNKFNIFTDFAAMSNPGIIPHNCSHFYPYRFDEWDHGAENDDIAEKYIRVNIERFLTYKKELGYKKVVVIMQNPHTQLLFDRIIDENIEGAKDWLYIVTSKELHKKVERNHLSEFKGSTGLMRMRMLSFGEVHEAYEKALGKALSSEEDKEKLKKVSELVNDPDISTQKRTKALRELGVKDYEEFIYRPSREFVDKYADDDDDDVNESQQEFESFVNKYLDKIKSNKFDKNDTSNWHKDRLYFTTCDVLLAYYDGKRIDHPDDRYWELESVLKKHGELTNFKEYCWYITDKISDVGVTEQDLKDHSKKVGVTQDGKKFKHI